VETITIIPGKILHSRTFTHGGGDADEAVIPRRHIAEPVAKNLLKLGFDRRVCESGGSAASDFGFGFGLNFGERMVANGILFSGQIALAFAGHYMEEDGFR